MLKGSRWEPVETADSNDYERGVQMGSIDGSVDGWESSWLQGLKSTVLIEYGASLK